MSIEPVHIESHSHSDGAVLVHPELPPEAMDVEREDDLEDFLADDETNKELLATYERCNDPAVDFEKNPKMPPLKLDGMSEDEAFDTALKSAHDWNALSLEDRRNHAGGAKHVEMLRDAAKAMGLKVETAGDLEAVERRLGMRNETKDLSPKVQAQLTEAKQHQQVFQKIAPDQPPAQTAQNVAKWTDHIAQHGNAGVRDLIVNHFKTDPSQLLSHADRAQVAHEMGVASNGLAQVADLYRESFARNGIDPVTGVAQLLKFEKMLHDNPETALKALIEQYADRVDPKKLMPAQQANHPAKIDRDGSINTRDARGKRVTFRSEADLDAALIDKTLKDSAKRIFARGRR